MPKYNHYYKCSKCHKIYGVENNPTNSIDQKLTPVPNTGEEAWPIEELVAAEFLVKETGVCAYCFPERNDIT